METWWIERIVAGGSMEDFRVRFVAAEYIVSPMCQSFWRVKVAESQPCLPLSLREAIEIK